MIVKSQTLAILYGLIVVYEVDFDDTASILCRENVVCHLGITYETGNG